MPDLITPARRWRSLPGGGSLNLLLGFAGLVSFGHAALFGLGAYTVGILPSMPRTGRRSASSRARPMLDRLAGRGRGQRRWRRWRSAPCRCAPAGVQFIMITLAFAQMLYYLFVSLKVYGGDDGLRLPPAERLPGLDLRDDAAFYLRVRGGDGVLVALCATGSCTRASAAAGRHPAERAADGGDRRAGLSATSWRPSCLRALGPGWRGRWRQPARLRQPRPDALDALRRHHDHGGAGRRGRAVRPRAGGGGDDRAATVLAAMDGALEIVLGPFLVVVSCAAPGLWGSWRGRRGDRAAGAARRWSKRFGGLLATDDLDLDVADGELHALIGPNGAGKTTLIAQLAASCGPTAGTIRFAGEDCCRCRAAPGQAGLTRSFQVTSCCRTTPCWRTWRWRCRRERATPSGSGACAADPASDRAAHALDGVGLCRGRHGRRPLAHGEQRQLELAVALATQPRMLLLDEPMAGLGPTEIQAMTSSCWRLEGQADDPAGRARHGRGVRAGRPGHRAGLRPRHRQRHARADPRRPGGPGRLSGRRGGTHARRRGPACRRMAERGAVGSEPVVGPASW